MSALRSTTTLPALLAARAAAEPRREAIRIVGGGVLDFAGWQDRAAAVAARIGAEGARPGDRIALRFGSAAWDDYACCFLGVLAAGCVAVPLPERAAPAEIRFILEHCEASGVLADDGPLPDGPGWRVRPDWAAGTGPRADGPGTGGHPAAVGSADGRAVPKPTDPAQILYTSGTTGTPKAVLADHANLAHGTTSDARHRPMRHCTRFLHAFPVGTNAGQVMLVNALNAHASALVAPRFTPRSFVRAITAHGVGAVFLVPATAAELTAGRAGEGADLSGVRLVGSTAAALPPQVAANLRGLFPNAVIVNTYTSTEAAPAQTTMVVDPGRPGALGRPVDGSLRIRDEHGEPAAAGRVGEVWLRSATSPRSYYGAGGADPEPVFAGQWIRMGDLGFLDADGYLHLVDRDSDVIKSGAFKVSTLQVEAALHEHPAVADAAVFSVPHPTLGAVPAAAVVITVQAPAVSAADLRLFLADRVAPHAVPGRIDFLPALPRNPAGKVLKRLLRQAAVPAVPAADLQEQP